MNQIVLLLKLNSEGGILSGFSISSNRLFRRAERSLFAQRHVKLILFFSCPRHSSEFHLVELKLHKTYGLDLSNFWMNTSMCSRSNKCETIGHRKLIFGELIEGKKFIFLDSSEGKSYVFQFCPWSKLGYTNVSALIDGRPFGESTYCDIFLSNFFSYFLSEQNRKIMNFLKQTCRLFQFHLRLITLMTIFSKCFVLICLLIALLH